MKKVLLVAFLIGTCFNPLLAEPQRKKSKESVMLKAVVGSVIFCKQAQSLLISFNHYLENRNYITFKEYLKYQASLPLLAAIIGSIIAKQGLNDLDEIAQER